MPRPKQSPITLGSEANDRPRGKLLKRAEAARLLGVSVSTLRRHEGDVIKPIIAENGVHLFEEAEIRSVKITVRRREAFAALGATSGDVAADVFQLLDEGIEPVEIVMRLRLPPAAVATLQEQWAQLRGGFVVDGNDAHEWLRLIRGGPISSGREATRQLRARIEALLRLHDSPRCGSCGENAAIICEACVLQRRGPLTTVGVRLERKTDDDGVAWIRVSAEVVWEQRLAPNDVGQVLKMCSEWCRADKAEESPIVEALDALANEAH